MMRPASNISSRAGGAVLLAVLVVSMLATMVAMSLLYRVRAEYNAAAAGRGLLQAHHAAMGGVFRAVSVLRRAEFEPQVWQDNPDVFREQLVHDDGSDKWYFTVYSPFVATGERNAPAIRYGVRDEASCINVNGLEAGQLRGLLAKLEESETSFLELGSQSARESSRASSGRDPDLSPTLPDEQYEEEDEDVDEADDGEALDPSEPLVQIESIGLVADFPLAVTGPAFTSLDSLVGLDGFSVAKLYGEDANLNFHLDPNENDGGDRFPPDNVDGVLDRGLRDVLTAWNDALALDHRRRPQVNINTDVERLAELALSEDTLRFLAAARRQTEAGRMAFTHVAELLGAKVTVTNEEGEEEVIESGVKPTDLPLLLDRCTTQTQRRRISSQININTASPRVLRTIPGVDRALADAIVSRRGSLDVTSRRTIAWLLTEGLVAAEQFKNLAPFMTARSFQYRLQVIGYGVPSGRYRILEAVFDLGYTQPRVVYLRDITRLGRPFALRVSEEEQGD